MSATLTLAERVHGALFGLFVADAVAMPVHWMYSLSQLKQDYGTITGYVKPKEHFQVGVMLVVVGWCCSSRSHHLHIFVYLLFFVSDQSGEHFELVKHGRRRSWV